MRKMDTDSYLILSAAKIVSLRSDCSCSWIGSDNKQIIIKAYAKFCNGDLEVQDPEKTEKEKQVSLI